MLLAASTTALPQGQAPPAATPVTPLDVVPITDPAPPPPAPGDDLAFTDAQDRMTVPVAIAGAGPYGFIVDTGAQRSVVSRQLARRLGLASGPRVRLTAMSETSEVDTVVVPSLSVNTPPIAGIGGARIEAPALDAVHLGAPGILGIDTLQGHSLAIDFDRRQMSVVPARKRGSARSGNPDEIVIRAKSLFGQLVVTDATIAGRRVRVILDTGTSVSLGNRALQRLIAGRRKDAMQATALTSVTGGTLMVDYATIRQMKLGSATIVSLPVAFADAAPFRVFGVADKPALMLGMDALRLFRRVDIDFANRELRLMMPRNAQRAI